MNIIQKIFGTHSQNELKRVYPIADAVMALDEDMQKLSDEDLKAKKKKCMGIYAPSMKCGYRNTKRCSSSNIY